MFSVKTQHSDPYTTTGLIRALYNFILVFLDISLLWSIFWFAKEARLPAAILSLISSSIMLSLVTVVPKYLDGSFYNKICRPYLNVRSYTQNIGHKKELNGCPQIRATVEHTGRTRWHDLRRPSCAERQSKDGSSTFHRLSSLVAGQLQALPNTTHISLSSYITTLAQWHVLSSVDIYRYRTEFFRQRQTLQ